MVPANHELSLRERVWRLFAGRERLAPTVAQTRIVHAQPPTLPAPGAKLSIVGLADVRERLGERWQELSERVHELAEVVIRRHLMRGDVFDAHGEDGYLVLFAQLSPAEAEFKCRVIAKEIAAKLLGADLALSSTVQGATFELDRTALDQPDFEQAVTSAVAVGTPVIEIEGPRAPRPPQESIGDSAKPPARLGAHGLSPIVSHAATYTPVWDFDVGALLHFRLSGGPSCHAAEAAPPTQSANADLAALATILTEVGRLAEVGRRLPVICPVALSTVGNEALRAQLVRVLRAAPPAIRKLVMLEIVAPTTARTIWPTTFTPDARHAPAPCALRLGMGSDPRRLALTGIQLITLELPPAFRADKPGLAALDLFARCALPTRLPLGVMLQATLRPRHPSERGRAWTSCPLRPRVGLPRFAAGGGPRR